MDHGSQDPATRNSLDKGSNPDSDEVTRFDSRHAREGGQHVLESGHSEQMPPSITLHPISPQPVRAGAQGVPMLDSRGRRTPNARSPDETRKREEENLRRQIKDIDAQIEKYKGAVTNLEQTNRTLSDQNIELEATWRKDLRELDTQRQALNANRSFVSREGTVDAQGLIQGFNDLNSSIGDFAYEVLRGLDSATEGRVLEHKHYEQISQALQDKVLNQFFENVWSNQLTTMDILDPIVQHVLCSQLMHTIFRPFAGLDMDRSLSLQGLYQRMRENEPQERSARWRSITYTHVATMRSQSFLEEAVEQYINNVSSVLSILSERLDLTLPSEYTTAASKIFQAAIKVQDKAKTEYVSFDYDVKFMEYGDDFNSSRMEVSQGGERQPRKVWLTVGLGMEATKSIVKDDRSIKLETTVPVKAMVICDNWDPNA